MADKGQVKPGTRDKKTILNDNIATYFHYRDSWIDHIKRSEESMNFFFGEGQWSATDKLRLDRKKLPRLTKNLILPIINRVSGMEIRNQTDMVVNPRRLGSEAVAQAMTRMNFYWKSEAKLNWYVSQAFVIGLISDMGSYMRPSFTTEFDPLGGMKYDMIYGPNVLPDPMFRRYDVEDSKTVVYSAWMTKNEATNKFPDASKDIKNLEEHEPHLRWSNLKRKVGFMTDLVQAGGSNTRNDSERMGGRYRAIERWRKMEQRNPVVFDPEGMETFFYKTKREKNEILFAKPFAFETHVTRKIMWVDISLGMSALLFSGPAKVQNGKYPFKPFYPYFLNGDMMGFLHNLKDYNREHNKRSSSILHLLMSIANSGWLLQEGSVDKKRWEIESSTTGANLYYRGAMPTKITSNSLPTGLVYTDEQAKQGIAETSGVGPNMMGRAENSRESGKIFEDRVTQGNEMLMPLFNNFSYTKDLVGEENIWHYQNSFSPEGLSIVLSENADPEQIAVALEMGKVITSQKQHGKYGVLNENVAKVLHEKQLTQKQLAALMQTAPPELLDWGSIIRSMDLAPEVREKMAAFADQRLGVVANAQDQAAGIQGAGNGLNGAD
jgi:hypothetical protein